MSGEHNPAHDPECYRRFLPEGEPPPWPCICEPLRLARADERERIAQAIDAAIQGIWNGMDFGLLKAARIARTGGGDER